MRVVFLKDLQVTAATIGETKETCLPQASATPAQVPVEHLRDVARRCPGVHGVRRRPAAAGHPVRKAPKAPVLLLGEQNRGVLMDESKIRDLLTHADRFKSVHWNSDACVLAPSIVVVKKMNALSTAIRQKERWWDKVHNDTVVLKWAAESKLGAESFDRVIAELQHLADNLADTRVRPEARPAPVDGVFESDGAVPPDALAALRNGADQLAADGPRDVHPGSNARATRRWCLESSARCPPACRSWRKC